MVIQAIQTCDVSFNEAQRAQTTVATRSQKNKWLDDQKRADVT